MKYWLEGSTVTSGNICERYTTQSFALKGFQVVVKNKLDSITTVVLNSRPRKSLHAMTSSFYCNIGLTEIYA